MSDSRIAVSAIRTYFCVTPSVQCVVIALAPPAFLERILPPLSWLLELTILHAHTFTGRTLIMPASLGEFYISLFPPQPSCVFHTACHYV